MIQPTSSVVIMEHWSKKQAINPKRRTKPRKENRKKTQMRKTISDKKRNQKAKITLLAEKRGEKSDLILRIWDLFLFRFLFGSVKLVVVWLWIQIQWELRTGVWDRVVEWLCVCVCVCVMSQRCGLFPGLRTTLTSDIGL